MTTVTHHDETLHFEHDPENRRLTGPDAARILRMIEAWDGRAILYGTQSERAPDPLGSARDFALMLLDYDYELPPELVALLPEPESIPEGAVA